ncbi:MAG: hypothetical protein HRU23_02320 [Gammaproteobacteria bacterium]|nr:hypothetical protein [Gammaproteobacteria bacterium]
MKINNKNICLIAQVTIPVSDEAEFKQLGSEIFPLIAAQTGWTLTSLWAEPSAEASEITLQNIWQTDLSTPAQVNEKLGEAVGALFETHAELESNLTKIDLLIAGNELFSYTTNFDY